MGHFKPCPEQLFITGHQLFFFKQFTDKPVEEELILYKKHVLAANYNKLSLFYEIY